MKPLSYYFDHAIKEGASDLHLVAHERPVIRVQGQLVSIAEVVLGEKELETAVLGILDSSEKKRFDVEHDLDFGYTYKQVRFRINIHRQEESMGLSARLVPTDIPTAETLRFEEPMYEATKLIDGLVLVVGPTGNGKSTTIARMVEEINASRNAHIITIEDPIEFVFESKKSLIEQRELGGDTPSFASALKHVLRQDPNIIMVGEMRDPETIATALTAAETGHVVFSTLHTSSAAEAIERIVDVFEGPKQKQVLIQLSSVLRYVIAQQLLPGVNNARIVAREILVNTPAVANLIRENNIAQMASAIQTGAKNGMITMEQSVKLLYKEGLISEETANNRMGRDRRI
ncbi:MAG: PilT/PilU family type 4a pilus ATPase [Candidatus Magasanikbacteria bacterium]|nr:PilT/PilU family type 4a pilus ATPase [Candidatus Magasanikbacteria bacterium]